MISKRPVQLNLSYLFLYHCQLLKREKKLSKQFLMMTIYLVNYLFQTAIRQSFVKCHQSSEKPLMQTEPV